VKINTNLRSSNRTRMTRIGRIFTDPCASVSSAQSVFYRTIFHPRADLQTTIEYKKTPPPAAHHRGLGSQPQRRNDIKINCEYFENRKKEPFFK